MLFIDEKYARILPLEGLELKSTSGRYFANFRCMICGDSQRSSVKKRGWFERHDNTLWYHCYNCGRNIPLVKFLKEYFPVEYKDYYKELVQTGGKLPSNFNFEPIKKESTVKADIFTSAVSSLNLQTIAQLPTDHKAVDYMQSRQIPEQYWNDVYYSDNFYDWCKEKQPDSFKKQYESDPRIVFPFKSKDGDVLGATGRTLYNKQPKYLTIKYNENIDKIFGLDRVTDGPIYVFEGPIDSLYLPNGIAMMGATGGLEKLLDYYDKDRLVVVADNEPRNKDTCKFIRKALNKGFKVVLWPSNWKYKDINEAVCDGYDEKYVKHVIDKSTVNGIVGITTLQFWRKC